MKSRSLLLVALTFCMLLPVMASSTTIDNPSFESVYLSSGRYYPSSWYVGTPLSLVPDSIQEYFMDMGALDGFVSTDAYDGTYSLANVYYPQNWNGSYSNFIDVYNYQSLIRSDNANYRISGRYKVNSSGVVNSTFADYWLRVDPQLKISFNLTAEDTWKYFEVSYDDGVCNVESGDVTCSVPSHQASTQIIAYTEVVYDYAQNVSNATISFLLDDLLIEDFQSLTGVGDYYTTSIMGLTGYGYTTSAQSGYTYYAYLLPTVDQFKVYQGRTMDSMKTKFLQLRFTEATTSSNGNCNLFQVAVTYVEYWNGTDWIREDSYDGFENDCGAFIDNPSYADGYSCYNEADFTPTFNIGLIVPQNATQFRVMLGCGRTHSGCGQYANGNTLLEFNTSSTIVSSVDEIDTSNAYQNVPTFFPVLNQYFEQNDKNLTIYHLNMRRFFTYNEYVRIDWVREDQLLTQYYTGNIPNESYLTSTYDTSSWALEQDDIINVNNSATTLDFFGVSYRSGSFYVWDSLEGGVCPPYCQSGSYFTGTFSGGNCYYSEQTCASQCLPSALVIETEDVGTDEATFNWTQMDSHYWELIDDNDTVIDSGTTVNRFITLTDLSPQTEYTFYVNGSTRYGCVLNYEDSVDFTTLAFPSAPSGWEEIYDTVEQYGEMADTGINIFLLFVGTALNTDVEGAKQIVWLALSLIVAVAVTYALAEKLKESSLNLNIVDMFLGIVAIMVILGLMVSWLPLVWAVMLIAIIGVLVFKLVGGS